MSTASPSKLSPAATGLLGAAAFLVGTVIVRFTVQCLGGLGIAGFLLATDAGFDPTDPTSIPTAFIAGITLVEQVCMAALALAFAFAFRPAAQTLALRIGAWPVYLAAVVGGLTVGLSFGSFGEWLSNVIPDWLQMGALDMISGALLEGPVIGRILMVLAVTLAAPVCEELVFRGALWGLLERAAPGWVVWLFTSALFALYHLDPVHVILVFPVGLLIGWMRLTSGSILPSILLHFINNTFAVVLVYSLSEDVVPPWYVAAIAGLFSALAFVFAAVFRRRSPAPKAP